MALVQCIQVLWDMNACRPVKRMLIETWNLGIKLI